MKKKIVFISGLWGVGKSSLVYYFLENPIKGFAFFDFDRGRYKAPAYSQITLDWRENQTRWWIEVAKKEFEAHGNVPVIAGLTLYPSQMSAWLAEAGFAPSDRHFWLLMCDPDARRDRLIGRGDTEHFQGHKPWYDEYFSEMDAVGAHKIETTDRNIDEVGKSATDWLDSLMY